MDFLFCDYTVVRIGFGRSSRPVFSENPAEAESQFVQAIEAWRVQMCVQNMILWLVGHSFGGFLVFAYALSYPNRCIKILPFHMLP